MNDNDDKPIVKGANEDKDIIIVDDPWYLPLSDKTAKDSDTVKHYLDIRVNATQVSSGS